jgi:hypothetical protein
MHEHFDIKAYFRNKTKTFWFDPLIIGTKAEPFNLFQNYLKSNQNVLAFFKVQKQNRIETFPYTYASWETKQNFCELFPNFFTSSERFCLLQAAQESKQNFCIFKKWYQNETKTLQIASGSFIDKTKRLDNLKKFWKRNKTKAFGPKMLRTDKKHFVLIQNFYLKTFTFDLFWNESSKTEASDIKRSLICHC